MVWTDSFLDHSYTQHFTSTPNAMRNGLVSFRCQQVGIYLHGIFIITALMHQYISTSQTFRINRNRTSLIYIHTSLGKHLWSGGKAVHRWIPCMLHMYAIIILIFVQEPFLEVTYQFQCLCFSFTCQMETKISKSVEEVSSYPVYWIIFGVFTNSWTLRRYKTLHVHFRHR